MEPNAPSMPPPPPPPSLPPQPPHAQPVQTDTSAKIIYLLYLASLLLAGVTSFIGGVGGIASIVGVVMAYVNVGDAAEPLRTHYRFQIRTFWLSLLYAFVGGLLLLALGLGLLVWLFAAVWLIVRCVKGLKYLDRREPYPNATTWLW